MNIKIADKNELKRVFALRFEVFVDEQRVPPEIELDSEDDHALHIIAEHGGITVGCARLLIDGDSAHIGRLAVKRDFRGQHIGLKICRFIIDYCRQNGYREIWLNSQLHAVGFYEKLGFSPEGKTFWEAGIEHVKMTAEI